MSKKKKKGFMEWLELVRCEHETIRHLEWLQEQYEAWEDSQDGDPPPDS